MKSKLKAKNNPFSAFETIEFRWFLGMRFFIILAWTMQFVLIEWEVYSITKSAWNLGLIGLLEVVPAIAMALFCRVYCR
ncbi:MAG: hypothetical protein V9G22_09555 [Ottowia sp.]